jgi:hypothetical protein
MQALQADRDVQDRVHAATAASRVADLEVALEGQRRAYAALAATSEALSQRNEELLEETAQSRAECAASRDRTQALEVTSPVPQLAASCVQPLNDSSHPHIMFLG